MAKKRLKKEDNKRRVNCPGHWAHGMAIPPDAIPADLSKHAPNNSWDPIFYYQDMEFRCADCGSEEVWTASQQKWWYEVAKGPVYSRAIRCRACRKADREKKEEHRLRSEKGRRRMSGRKKN